MAVPRGIIHPSSSNSRLSQTDARVSEGERFVCVPKLKRECVMTRNSLIALAGGTAIALGAPLPAQSATQAPAQPQPSAQAPAAAPAADAANAGDQSTQASDTKAAKAKPKAKADSTGGTVVRAGPNAGMVIGKAKKPKDDTDASTKTQAGEQPGSEKCTADHPCQ
jgi:Zn-dependent M28 family amino/carboxypeptidase